MNKAKTANAVEAFLKKNKRLKPLLANARLVMKFDFLLKLYLEEPLKSKCQVSIFHGHRLLIFVDAPVWATQLRYQIPSLLKQLQQHPEMVKLTFIEIKIQSEPLTLKKETRSINPISFANSEVLKTTAANVDDDNLKKALLRLSRHTRI
ncbi:MAG: DUF721 domain-containing protein [Pseudomonadales bacterium]|nr:DUF721 domain-containing protein [Pseudomonadales bacterium]